MTFISSKGVNERDPKNEQETSVKKQRENFLFFLSSLRKNSFHSIPLRTIKQTKTSREISLQTTTTTTTTQFRPPPQNARIIQKRERTKRKIMAHASSLSSSLLVLSFSKASFGGRGRRRRSKRSNNPLRTISADSNNNNDDDSEDENNENNEKSSFFFSTTSTIDSTRGRRRRSRAANNSNNINNNSSQEEEEELSSTIIRNSVIKNSNKSSSSSQSSAFELAGGFLYVRNFFEKEDFEKIARACDDLRKHLKEEKRVCANSRLGVMVPEEDVVHQMCCSEFAAEKLRELVLSDEEKLDAKKRNALKPSDVPVEYRIYPFGGSMDWHRDVALYTEPQFEIVCTIHNSSDSRTEWKDVDTGRRRGIRSEPNSVLIVQADSVVHRVTPITKGERSIVKFAYSTTNEKTVDYYDNLLTYNDDYEPTEGSNGKRAATTSSSSSSTSENFPSPH